MLSRDDIVRATSEQNRSFATIGLLRQVSEATPIDMVCTYIIQTNQPWGLKDKVHDLNYAKRGNSWRDHMTIRNNRDADRIHYFPEGITRMAKDYLIRAFWKQIDHLRGTSCMRVSTDGSYTDFEDSKVPRMRVFPKNVLDVLASCHIHHSARLWDAQHAIGALHAVCTPLMLDNPSWVKMNNYGYQVEDMNQFDTLKSNHSRAIGALISVLDNYCWNTNNRSHIPNDAEKNILLDLIECFLVMFGPGPFSRNFRVRQIYEYSRIGDIVADNRPTPRGDCCCSCPSSMVMIKYSTREWSNGVITVLQHLKHLSPEATICLGGISNRLFSCMSGTQPALLKELHPQPLKEVELYLKTEFDVQCQKKSAAERIREQFRRGEFTDANWSIYNAHNPNGGDEACAPCEPAEAC